MTGALLSLSACGVIFSACVIFLILGAMLYDSFTKSRVKNIQSYEFTASPEVATGTHSDGIVLLYLSVPDGGNRPAGTGSVRQRMG
jgi:hypothetical protein